MNAIHTEESLLYLVAPTEVEATLVDWLIESDLIKGFSSVRINGHGSDNRLLSIAEQVEGRRWQTLYFIRMPQTQVDPVLQALKKEMAHIGIEYWIVPVLEYGKII
ncbi:MAG TPA: DUF3240 family protein [Gammaproteobacteria bacterium]|nr:DUF3240 family protein [Gammaproteobacteria bacterium]